MNNKRWGNYGNYGDTEILLMRALTEDTFDVVMVTPLPDDRARFLHRSFFVGTIWILRMLVTT